MRYNQIYGIFNMREFRMKYANGTLRVILAILLLTVSGLAAGCGGGGGGSTPAPVDSIAPAVTISMPASGTEYTAYSPTLSISPSMQIAADYSDDSGSVNLSTLAVTFTLMGSTVDITDMFGASAVTNATSTQTQASVNMPVARYPLTRYAAGGLTAAEKTWGLKVAGTDNIGAVAVDSSRLVAWSRSGTSSTDLAVIDATTGQVVKRTVTGIVKAGVATSNRFYAIGSDASELRAYSLADLSSLGTSALPYAPECIAYNSAIDRLYISFATQPVLEKRTGSTGALIADTAIGHIPSVLAARPSSAGHIVSVGPGGGGAMLYLFTDDGVDVQSVYVGAQRPASMIVTSTGAKAVMSMPSDSTAKIVDLSTGAVASVSTGTYPSAVIEGAGGRVIVCDISGYVVTTIDTLTSSTVSTITKQSAVIDGVYLSGPADYFLIHDIWNLPAREPLVITASVRDAAGNTGTRSVTVYATPPSPGRVVARR